tara:strand:+ start:210 stop:737 length:528 start_codon:yes stop_codon:yes gene_type:complete
MMARLPIKTYLLALAATAMLAGGVFAQTAPQVFPPSSTGLPIPRFVSLKGDPVNLRAGPGVRYPVRWVYVRPGLPLMVTGEFEYWRRVRDPDGAEGWIHKSLLRGTRTAMLREGLHLLRSEPRADAPVAARAEAGVIAELAACKGGWCRLETEGAAGWVERGAIYGALPEEEFER